MKLVDGETVLRPRAMVAVLGVALAIRLFVAMRFANAVVHDEVYQYLEQAHRLVFGQGLVPWEYQVGLRNWLIPMLLAVPMALAHIFFVDPLAGLILIRFCMCIASLGIVWCAARLGERFFGIQGFWVAGFAAAIWPDLWLMAPHTLTEVFAADCLVPAMYLIETRAAQGDINRVALAGFLFGLTFVFRIQLAPAIGLAGIFLCRRNSQYWRIGLLAGVLPVLSAGMLDWFTWGQPFRSFWLDVYLNLFRGMAAHEFGRNPALYYVHVLELDWLWMFPIIVVLCWQWSKKLPACGVTVAIILLTHSLIAHKEIRFLFPALAVATLLIGPAIAGLWVTLRQSRYRRWWVLPGVLALAGPFCSPLMISTLHNNTLSFQMFESIKDENSGVVAVNAYPGAYLPLDILFLHPNLMQPMTDADLTRLHPGSILSADPTYNARAPYRQTACFAARADQNVAQLNAVTCIWRRNVSHPAVPPAPMVNFGVPMEAQSFEITDRLFPDEKP